NLKILTLSIDDLYLWIPHNTLTALTTQNPTNPFLRNRDIPLGTQLFENIDDVSSRVGFGYGDCDILYIPPYDKSRHGGKGD
ncbi:hypothetical protein DFH27DRAFT_464100, partial [Peziza echinospora]